MKKYLLIALLLATGPAIATTNPPNPCGNHGNNCDPDPPTTTNPVTNEQNQGQLQGQAQGQGQGQSQTAAGGSGTGIGVGIGQGGRGGAGGQGGTAVAGGGSATGGNAQGGAGGTATSGSASGAVSGSLSGVQGSGNASLGDVGSTSAAGALSNASNGDQSLSGTQTVTNTNGGNTTASGASADGSGNSDTSVTIGGDRNSYRALYIPSVIPQGQLAITSAGNLSVTDAACGPLMAIEREPQRVLVKGMFGGTKLKEVGYTERLVPYTENGVWKTQLELEIRGVVHTYGHRITRYAAQNGTAMASGISIGGGGNNGWGQAGTNGSSSVQQVQRQYDLALCELDVIEPQLPAIEFKEPRVPRG